MTYATLRPTDTGAELTGAGGLLATISAGSVERSRRDAGAVGPEIVGDGDLSAEGRIGDAGLVGRWSARRIGGQDVWELTLVLRNEGSEAVSVTRADPCALDLDLDRGHWRTRWYRSAWGDEFRAEQGTTRHDAMLEVRAGRSSHGMIPWLGFEAEGRDAALVVAPAWSGNWHITALSGGHVTAGVSPWQFSVELQPGEELNAPSVVIAAGGGLDETSLALQRAVRDDWMPRTPFTDGVPVEWNHWWPYEDQEVTEDVIVDNARAAADLGIEIATVDAGWFGAPDSASDWQEQRGDWGSVNSERFPGGLSALGDRIRAAGVEAGAWIEAEAVGRSSRLRAEHPGLLAAAVDGRRHDPSYRLMTVSLDPEDPGFLGYVCLGSASGRTHVLESMSRLVTDIGARWIKLDFNVDPDAGCTRTDHGHGAGDGLLRHYEGLYAVLDEFRTWHPEVMLEACSSGGLRIDLGLARHVHGFFLSDPDYTEHHLEVLMGASRLLPPLGILHWSQSQWRGDYPPQRLDWAELDEDAFDTMLRSAMLHRFGVSLRLPELRVSLRARLAEHVALYRRSMAGLVRDGVLRPLTDPPARGGLGERAPALQLSDEASDRHVAAQFVLAGGDRPAAVLPRGLDRDRDYAVTDLATNDTVTTAGGELLAAGIPLVGRASVSSWLFGIAPIGGFDLSDPEEES